jgi:hypothetical protein
VLIVAASLVLHVMALLVAQIAYAPYSVGAPPGCSDVSASGAATTQSSTRG